METQVILHGTGELSKRWRIGTVKEKNHRMIEVFLFDQYGEYSWLFSRLGHEAIRQNDIKSNSQWWFPIDDLNLKLDLSYVPDRRLKIRKLYEKRLNYDTIIKVFKCENERIFFQAYREIWKETKNGERKIKIATALVDFPMLNLIRNELGV